MGQNNKFFSHPGRLSPMQGYPGIIPGLSTSRQSLTRRSLHGRGFENVPVVPVNDPGSGITLENLANGGCWKVHSTFVTPKGRRLPLAFRRTYRAVVDPKFVVRFCKGKEPAFLRFELAVYGEKHRAGWIRQRTIFLLQNGNFMEHFWGTVYGFAMAILTIRP